MFADRAGQTEVAQILVRAGADPTGGARSRALSAAVASGDLHAVRASLKAGADPDVGDDEGKRPLEVAIRAKRRDLALVLIAAGADLNANQNASGYTPLRLAITTGQPDLVRALLAAGADPNARSSIAGSLETPLLAAVGTGLE
jgi:ankyrin repeat protein